MTSFSTAFPKRRRFGMPHTRNRRSAERIRPVDGMRAFATRECSKNRAQNSRSQLPHALPLPKSRAACWEMTTSAHGTDAAGLRRSAEQIRQTVAARLRDPRMPRRPHPEFKRRASSAGVGGVNSLAESEVPPSLAGATTPSPNAHDRLEGLRRSAERIRRALASARPRPWLEFKLGLRGADDFSEVVQEGAEGRIVHFAAFGFGDCD